MFRKTLIFVCVALSVFVSLSFRRTANWRIHTGSAVVRPVVFTPNVTLLSEQEVLYKKTIYSVENDVLRARDNRSGKERWRITLGTGFVFSDRPLIASGRLFVGDTTGTLRAIGLHSGKTLWELAQQESPKSFPRPSGRPGWFGSMAPEGSRLVVGGRDGRVTSLRQNDGKKLWTYEVGNPIVNVQSEDGSVFALGQNGSVTALTSGGRLVWTETQASSAAFLLFPKATFGKRLLGHDAGTVVVVTRNGDVIGKDTKSGRTLHTTHLAASIVTKPAVWQNWLFVVTKEPKSRLIKIDGVTGAIAWSRKYDDVIGATPVVGYRNPLTSGLCARTEDVFGALPFCMPSVFVGDYQGVFRAVDVETGDSLWKFFTTAPIVSPASFKDNSVVFGNLGGDVYTVLAFDGKIPRRRGWLRMEVSRTVSTVFNRDIQEFTLRYDQSRFRFPWSDILAEASFSQKGLSPITVSGYYFDKDTWKIAFNPPFRGEWQYEVRLVLPDNSAVAEKGSFVSKTSSDGMYLKSIYVPGGVGRLTADGKHAYSVFGVQTSELDFNRNGNFLDDFSFGVESPSTGSAETECFSCGFRGLEDFLTAYADGGQVFNMFRWGPNNASFGLADAPPSATDAYYVFEGRQADRLITSLANHGLRVWLTFFESTVPHQAEWSASPLYEFLAKRYIRYLVSRYGAYVSIWELTNEAYVPDRIVQALTQYLRTIDFEKRPITTSWEKAHLSTIEVVSPHWYADEDSRLSDAALLKELERSQGSTSGKPVVFGEIGNKSANWDPESGARMRIRMWTAAMRGAGVVFWSTSHSKQYAPVGDPFGNGNQYIGEKERELVRIANGFFRDMSLDARPIDIGVNPADARGYGLGDKQKIIGYIHRYSDHERNAPIEMTLQVPKNGTLSWYDTKTGKKIISQRVPAGRHVVTSPAFLIDVAFAVMLDP